MRGGNLLGTLVDEQTCWWLDDGGWFAGSLRSVERRGVFGSCLGEFEEQEEKGRNMKKDSCLG